MRVFITGSTGFIGTATTQELIKNGHSVLGLVRTDAQAEALTKAGGEPHRGGLEDLEALKSGAKSCDGVVHLAYIHDFSNLDHSNAVDRASIEVMGEVMAGTGKPLIISSGTLAVPKNGQIATEETEAELGTPLSGRAKSAELLFAMSKEKNIRGMVVRFSPTVHGAGDKGLIPMIVDTAKKSGSILYIGDGSARWPACHRYDAAVLLRLMLEKGRSGATYNAVQEGAVSMKDIMTVAAKKLSLPVEGKSSEEAMGALGFFAFVLGMDNPTSSEKTQKELGWKPTGLGLLEDLEANYFSS